MQVNIEVGSVNRRVSWQIVKQGPMASDISVLIYP
jgi:hypothetical protein